MTAAGSGLSAPGTGAGESMSLDFRDPGRGLFGIVRFASAPAAGLVEAAWAVLEPRKPPLTGTLEGPTAERLLDGVEMEGLRVEVDGASGVSLALSTGELVLDLEAQVAGQARAPASADATEASPARAAGFDREEQLCDVTGRLELGDSRHSLSCRGMWTRSNGTPRWDEVDRWRSFYAATEAGPSILVAAARPRNGAGTEVSGAELRLGDEPISFEVVRLSTVWGEDGLPATASVELFAEGDEIPRRYGGETMGGARLSVRDGSLGVAFLRWSVEGEPAFGCYETLLPG